MPPDGEPRGRKAARLNNWAVFSDWFVVVEILPTQKQNSAVLEFDEIVGAFVFKFFDLKRSPGSICFGVEVVLGLQFLDCFFNFEPTALGFQERAACIEEREGSSY